MYGYRELQTGEDLPILLEIAKGKEEKSPFTQFCCHYVARNFNSMDPASYGEISRDDIIKIIRELAVEVSNA
jgi:Ca2+-binding EF-hand superfamily protein